MGLVRSPGQLANADRRHPEVRDRDGEYQEGQDERVGTESRHAQVSSDDRERDERQGDRDRSPGQLDGRVDDDLSGGRSRRAPRARPVGGGRRLPRGPSRGGLVGGRCRRALPSRTRGASRRPSAGSGQEAAGRQEARRAAHHARPEECLPLVGNPLFSETVLLVRRRGAPRSPRPTRRRPRSRPLARDRAPDRSPSASPRVTTEGSSPRSSRAASSERRSASRRCRSAPRRRGRRRGGTLRARRRDPRVVEVNLRVEHPSSRARSTAA